VYCVALRWDFEEYCRGAARVPRWAKACSGGVDSRRTLLYTDVTTKDRLITWMHEHGLHTRVVHEHRLLCVRLPEIAATCPKTYLDELTRARPTKPGPREASPAP